MLEKILLVIQYLLVLVVLNFIGTAVYNVYFHPLSRYPGPKLAAATGSFWNFMVLKGDLPQWVRRQHDMYGEVVRLAPDRLCYISPQAWKDIYGHRTGGRLENGKDPLFYQKEINGEYHVLSTPDTAAHGRLRKIFTNAFSDKALKLQEPLIKKYADQLIEVIQQSSKDKDNVGIDMVKLYNCTTFDIMADLTFREPLGMLNTSDYTPWVKNVFEGIKIGVIFKMCVEYPMLDGIIQVLSPKWIRDAEQYHLDHSAERVDRRLTKGLDKQGADIWNLVLEKGDSQMNLGQMHANSSLFMAAGTETTATLLSGLTFHLLKNPDKLKKVTDEVRAIPLEALTLEELPRLSYLNACFEEAFRVYPPVPAGLPRVTPKGGSAICGEWVPEKTRVTVTQWAANRSPLNFKDAESFLPERWLPDSGYDTDRKDAMQPFVIGPRNCLGKNLAYHEMRIIMADVLWHFDLELCQQSATWADQKAWVLWNKPQLWVKAKPIH